MGNAHNQNSQHNYEELQQEYDLLTEEIQFLRQREKTDDLSPRELFRLKKQIEQSELERAKVSEKLSIQEAEDAPVSLGDSLYQALLRLGYRKQIRMFRRLVESEPIAAFLIHGLPDYGQSWLLNRLVVQYVPYLLTGKIIRVNVSRKVRRSDVSALWRELAGRVGLKGKPNNSPVEIAQQVGQCLQTQNVLLIFHDVDKMPESSLHELIQSFWLPLVTYVQSDQSCVSKFKLLMFLVDYEGCVDSWEVPFAERVPPCSSSPIPVKSPRLIEFSEDDLMDWIEAEFDRLPSVLTGAIDETVGKILAGSDDGIPELALERICEYCDRDWYEESEKWLKL